MIHIDTEVDSIIIEIDDGEYPLADNTIEVQEKLLALETEYQNKPKYKLCIEELKVLLGDRAVSAIFPAGKKENVNRIFSIYNGVRNAFNRHMEQLEASDAEKQIQAVATALTPINDLFRNLNTFKGNKTK